VQAGLDEIRARTAGSAAAKGKSKSKTTKKSKK
jgi:hypothetical protein